VVVIRKGKKKVILSVLAGAAGMGILCTALFFVYMQKAGIKPSDLFLEENRQEEVTAVCLGRNVEEGEVLSDNDLEEVMLHVATGKMKGQSRSEYEGKCTKLSMEKGTFLSSELVYDFPGVADDERLLDLSYVKLNEKMEAGDYVDIRISFRNGSDYVLLSRKKICDISGNGTDDSYGETGNALWLQVNEEEILRLASAVVDSFYQEGCEIYAIEYVSEMQKEAKITYPVNATVKKLISQDANITELAQGNLSEEQQAKLRESLESELTEE
jgi:hypothetical protein